MKTQKCINLKKVATEKVCLYVSTQSKYHICVGLFFHFYFTSWYRNMQLQNVINRNRTKAPNMPTLFTRITKMNTLWTNLATFQLKKLKRSPSYFYSFSIISPSTSTCHFTWTGLLPLMMLWATCGWKWPNGSEDGERP